jgi:predicted kinase
MSSKVKRTYNLDPGTVRRVRELSEQYGVAPSQDAVVELAIDELERRLLEQRESDAWAAATADRAYRAEVADLATAYETADRETWPS